MPTSKEKLDLIQKILNSQFNIENKLNFPYVSNSE